MGTNETWRRAAPIAAVMLFALLLHGVHQASLADAPFQRVLLGDARSYDAWGREIAAGDWVGEGVFYQAPLYPYFLGAVYTVFGPDPESARKLQIALAIAACGLVAWAGGRLFSRNAGLIAGALLAAYAPTLFFTSLIGKTVLDLFFLAVALALIAALDGPESAPRPRARTAMRVGLGASLGALVLTRENALLLLPVLVVWLALKGRGRGERMGTTAGSSRIPPVISHPLALLVGLAVVLTPVMVRNALVGGEFHLTTSQFGPNFWMGNSPESQGTYQAMRFGRGDARYERTDATLLAEEAVGRTLSPAEVSGYWTDRSLTWMRENPGDWLRLLARKFALSWNALEMVDTEDQYTYAEWSWPLRVAGRLLHFGTLAPLAVLGVFVARRRRGTFLLAALSLVYMSGLLLFYVVARYRYPMAPFLALLAAAGAVGLPAFIRAASRREVALAAVAVAGTAVFSNWTFADGEHMRGVTWLNVGNALREQGDVPGAEAAYRAALEHDPQFAPAHHSLALELAAAGRSEEALRHYRHAAAADPGFAPTHFNLAGLLQRSGEIGPAIQAYDNALRLRPDWAEAHVQLGNLLALRGEAQPATEHFRRALETNPEDVGALIGLARLGAVDPNAAPLDRENAIRAAAKAVELTRGGHALALDTFSVALAAVGRALEAQEVGRRALVVAEESGNAALAAHIRERLERAP